MPSALCGMTVCPLARVLTVLFAMPTEFVPLYVVPLTVTLHAFDAVELIKPAEPETSWSSQPMNDLLFSTLWLIVHQVNFSVSYDVTATEVLPLVAMLALLSYE